MISWKCIVSSFTLRCNQLQSLQQRSSFGLLQPFSFSSLLVSKWCSTHAQAGSALPWLPAQSRNTGSKLAAGCSLLKGLIFLHTQGRFNSIAVNGRIPCLSQTPHSRHITAWLYFLFKKHISLCLEETHDLWLLLSQSSLNQSASQWVTGQVQAHSAYRPPASWQHHGDRLENWLQRPNAWCRHLAQNTNDLSNNPNQQTIKINLKFDEFWTLNHLESHVKPILVPSHTLRTCVEHVELGTHP